MDSFTHIFLGACIGEAFLGRKIGKRAMFLGAVAQSIPDIDFIASFWLNTTEDLLAHRGFTHSILFVLLVSVFLALIAERWHRPHNISLKTWILFFGTELCVHLFLDAFNNYGVGWFEPFSHRRISFNILYVADPFFTIFPAISFFALLILPRRSSKRRFWWRLAIITSSLYLSYGIYNKVNIDREVKRIFQKQNITHARYFTTPAPLQNWLWYVISGNDSGYYAGFRSVFDRKESMSFQYFPRNDSLIGPFKNHKDVVNLIRFSQQFYTVEKWKDTLVFNDLRFGQIIGWQNPKEKFVFHYFLEHPDENTLVVQRGRFAKWDRKVVTSFIRRIKGE